VTDEIISISGGHCATPTAATCFGMAMPPIGPGARRSCFPSSARSTVAPIELAMRPTPCRSMGSGGGGSSSLSTQTGRGHRFGS
jgi:hypothetical protein